MRLFTISIALGATTLLAACGSSPSENLGNTAASTTSEPAAPATPSAEPSIAEATTTPYPIEACKAAIGTVMGRDPATIKGRKLNDGLIHVSYIRPDDGKRWQARCRIDGATHLTWAAFDAFGDGQQGRWRNEDAIEFTVNDEKMTVRYSTGGELMSEDTYRMSKLK